MFIYLLYVLVNPEKF
ncbi:potassium-transporting ATPase subunit F [Paenibacillus turpanensis]